MINRFVGVGRITADPVIKKSASGTSIVKFNIAINRKNDKEKTDYISCVAFGGSAEFMDQYVKKGYLLGVEGRLQTGSYENQKGDKVYTTDVMCDSVQNYQPKGSITEVHSELKNGDSFTMNDIANTLDISESDLPF